MSILEQVIDIVADETGKRITDLTAETRFDSLGIDSLDFIALIQALESRCKCQIPDAEYVNLQTIGDVAARC